MPMQKINKICIAYAKLKKNLYCPCKEIKINCIALPMKELKRICIAMQKIKITCIANAKNKMN